MPGPQIPDRAPYPYTASNLSRTATELCLNAVIKESYGRFETARHCRRLAVRRLREAGALNPKLAGHYEDKARRVEGEQR